MSGLLGLAGACTPVTELMPEVEELTDFGDCLEASVCERPIVQRCALDLRVGSAVEVLGRLDAATHNRADPSCVIQPDRDVLELCAPGGRFVEVVLEPQRGEASELTAVLNVVQDPRLLVFHSALPAQPARSVVYVPDGEVLTVWVEDSANLTDDACSVAPDVRVGGDGYGYRVRATVVDQAITALGDIAGGPLTREDTLEDSGDIALYTFEVAEGVIPRVTVDDVTCPGDSPCQAQIVPIDQSTGEVLWEAEVLVEAGTSAVASWSTPQAEYRLLVLEAFGFAGLGYTLTIDDGGAP